MDDIERRLAEFARLSDGWISGDGQALDREGLRWLTRTLTQAVEVNEITKPYLYPTPDGGVQAEWDLPDASVTAEFELKTHIVRLLGVHHRSQASNEKQVDLSDTSNIAVLASFVMNFDAHDDPVLAKDESGNEQVPDPAY